MNWTIWNHEYHPCLLNFSHHSKCLYSSVNFLWVRIHQYYVKFRLVETRIPELTDSSIILRTYDGFPSWLIGFFQNILIKLTRKKFLIDIEVLDAPLITTYCFDKVTCIPSRSRHHEFITPWCSPILGKSLPLTI